MGDAEKCQQKNKAAADHVCRQDVHQYRSCGAGCHLVIAYCKDHGGDKRAGEEMSIHIKTRHPEKL